MTPHATIILPFQYYSKPALLWGTSRERYFALLEKHIGMTIDHVNVDFLPTFALPLDVSAGHSSRAEVALRLSISSLVISPGFQALDHGICTGFKLMPFSQAGISEFDRPLSLFYS